MKKTRFAIALLILIAVLISTTVPSTAQEFEVKKFELEKTTSSFVYGEVRKYWVSFSDGTSGYMWYSIKYELWYISDGASDWEYKDKEKAIKALYIYKTERGKISDDGRIKK